MTLVVSGHKCQHYSGSGHTSALRNTLLSKKILSQEEIDPAVRDIFAKIALDKTLGARTDLLNAFGVPKIDRAGRAMLHPYAYRE